MRAIVKTASLAALAAVALLSAGPLRAQEEFGRAGGQPDQDLPAKSEGPVSFSVDTGVFFEENGPPVVEVYLEAPYDELPFTRRSGGYVSQVEVIAIFRNRSGDQAGGDSWSRDIWVEDYNETIDPNNAYRALARFAIPPGEYDLKLSCGGAGSGFKGVARKRFKVPEPPRTGLALSDIRLGFCGAADSTAGSDAASAAGSDADRPGASPAEFFVPSGTRSFGADAPAICALAEAYSLDGVGADSLRVDAVVVSEEGKTVWEESRAVPRTGRETHVTLSVPVDSLAWGAYSLRLIVRDGDHEARAGRRFDVDETRVDVSMDADLFMDLMSLVATAEELETLASLGGSERRAYLDEIWKKRDSDPGTPGNEFKIRFFRRVKHAKSSYQEPGREGWQTDRGRVFIKNGPPDRIDVREGVTGSISPDARMEIWYYDATNTHYVFEDFGGSGEYTLVDVVQG